MAARHRPRRVLYFALGVQNEAPTRIKLFANIVTLRRHAFVAAAFRRANFCFLGLKAKSKTAGLKPGATKIETRSARHAFFFGDCFCLQEQQ